MAGEVDLWVLDYDGADVTLPDLGDYSVTPIASGVGSVSVDYPADGRRFAALRALVDEDRPIDVELRVDGTSANAVGALLFTASGDAIAPGAVWTFTGYTLEVVMRRARTPHNTDTGQGGNERGETSLSGTPGVIMRTLMQRAQARGVLTNVTFGSFSNTLDSNGQAWAKTASVVLAPGRDYAEILTTVLYENALADWQVVRTATGYELRLYNPGTLGVDRALPGPGQVTIEHGRDMEDAPVKHDVTDVATRIIAAGKDGAYQTGTNASAEARLGYRVEGYASFGEVSDPGTLTAAAQLAATDAGSGRTEHTHGLLVVDDKGNTVPGAVGRPLPGRDFGLSDWILRAVDGQVTREQVVRYTLARRGREVRCATTLGSVIEARSVVLRRAIDALTNGSTVAGASAPPPDFDDGKAPAAPTGLTGTSVAYYDSAGVPSAQVTGSWLAVTTNADGTPIGDLSGYELQFRYLPGQAGNLPSDWQTVGITAATTLRWSPLVQGRAIELRVLAYDRYQRESAWSNVFPLTTATDADAPAVASAPTPYSHLGLLVVPWDGRGVGGVAMPGDFEVAEIHVSTTTNFTPSRPLDGQGRLDLGASTTYVGELRGAGEFPVDIGASGYGTTYYVKLVTRDRSGNAAAASAQGSAVLSPVADGDIAELNIGKLRAGILTAIMTVAGRISTRTGAGGTGAGWEGDSVGFRFMNAANQAVLEFIAATAELLVTGTVQTGRTGRRVVLSGAGNDVRFYPQAGETRFGRISSYVPTNYPNDVAVEIKASDADELDVVSRINVLPQFVSMGVQNQANNTQSWTRFFANQTALRAELYSSPGVRSAELSLDTGLNELSTRATDQKRSTWIYGYDDGNFGLSCRMRAGFIENGQVGDVFVNQAGYSFIGTDDPGNSRKFGWEYQGSQGFGNARVSAALQVTDPSITAWRPVRASAFEVQCSAQVKEGFEALPSAALDVLRRSPVARYRRDGDPVGVTQVGPVAEDLPAWLLRPRTGPAVRVETRPGPARETVDEATGERILERGPDEHVEVPAGLPDSERLDVLSYVATVAAAVRELDAELDDYRRARGRPVPLRRSVDDLLGDLRAGRLRSAAKASSTPTADPDPAGRSAT